MAVKIAPMLVHEVKMVLSASFKNDFRRKSDEGNQWISIRRQTHIKVGLMIIMQMYIFKSVHAGKLDEALGFEHSSTPH